MQDDGTGDWEKCDECGKLVCFDIGCPNGWRWNGSEIACYTHDKRVDDRPAIERYGTPEHEAWLIEMEERE